MRGLNGKVAIVTGATGEMGETVANRLAAEGVKILCCARNSERGEQSAARIRAGGWEAHFCHADVAVEADVRLAIAAAIGRFARLDTVVNLAAATDLLRSGGAHRVTEESREG